MAALDSETIATPAPDRRLLLYVPVYGFTIFLSALLLFCVQPMFSKMVLPLLGGTSAVWSVAMVVFQTLLLGGYAYAWLLTSTLSLKQATLVHLGVLLLATLCLPIAVAHGEGYANFAHRGEAARVQAAMRFVDHTGQPTEQYPFNPNGSAGGLTGVTTPDGRFTAFMPHPERVFRNIQMSWTGGEPADFSPWMHLWHNARRWVG